MGSATEEAAIQTIAAHRDPSCLIITIIMPHYAPCLIIIIIIIIVNVFIIIIAIDISAVVIIM